MTFDWKAPARLGVVETRRNEQLKLKYRYDVQVAAHDSKPDHIVITTSNPALIELDGQQINLSVLPSTSRNQIRGVMAGMYARPGLVINSLGEITGFTHVEDSIRQIFEYSDFADEQAKQEAIEFSLQDPAINQIVKNSAIEMWSCWVANWLDFGVELNSQSTIAITPEIAGETGMLPGVQTLSNLGFYEGDDSNIHLKLTYKSGGPQLVRKLVEEIKEEIGTDTGLEGADKVATGSSTTVGEVKINPASMKPVWARCRDQLVIESTDQSVIKSRNDESDAEYVIQWLN